MHSFKSRFVVVSCAIVFSCATTTVFAQPVSPSSGAKPSWTWAAAQLVPSPQLVVQHDQLAFGARWQLTPVLFSYGIHRSLEPWRFFVVEPIVRQSGSIEWFLSPEYIAVDVPWARRFGLRSGIRSYVALLERGDYLSASFGVSALWFDHKLSSAYEAGLHTLFGFVGLMVSYSPTPDARRFITTLQLRVF